MALMDLKFIISQIFNTSCNAIKGAEALIRWNSEKYGFMSPVDFIPLLEESSLIIPLGKMDYNPGCAAV